jgi:hypothetical protein
MAKMFYTLEETAEKLNVSVDEVKSMAASGQLKEFRDRDKLIFKVEQVDLLAHKDDHSIPLADSGGGSSLTLSLEDSGGGSGVSLESPKEKSGISIFDTDELESADPMAQTQVSATGAQELTTESVGSGSGLLDLTREGDDTSLGADLLQDVYSEEKEGEEGETQAASGLFETTPAASDVSSSALAAPALAMVAAEPYDGPGSGMAGGVALATVAICALALAATVLGIVGVLENPVVGLLPPNPMMWFGIFAGAVLIFGIIGWVLGRKG